MLLPESPIHPVSGMPVGFEMQNQQELPDPDDSTQLTAPVGCFPAFCIHR